MANLETLREPVSGGITDDLLRERTSQGWRLAGVVWEREKASATQSEEPIPYGATVSSDGSRLVDLPEEREVLVTMLEMIVADRPLSHISDELNRRGLRNRQNKPWTVAEVFDLLPRLIDVGPRLVNSPDWVERRARLTATRT